MATRKLAASRPRTKSRAAAALAGPAERPKPERWSVYMIRRSDGALYTGIALDVERRFAQHVEGKGAKALRGRGPLELVLRHRVGERGTALRLERLLKRLPKSEKERVRTSRRRLEALVHAARTASL
jgi:putative endonuclease